MTEEQLQAVTLTGSQPKVPAATDLPQAPGPSQGDYSQHSSPCCFQCPGAGTLAL